MERLTEAMEKYGDKELPKDKYLVEGLAYGVDPITSMPGLLEVLNQPNGKIWLGSEFTPVETTAVSVGLPVRLAQSKLVLPDAASKSWVELEEEDELLEQITDDTVREAYGHLPISYELHKRLTRARIKDPTPVKAPHRSVTAKNDGRVPPTARWEPDKPPSAKTLARRVRYNKLRNDGADSSDVAEEEEYLYQEEEARRVDFEQQWVEAGQDEAEEHYNTSENWKGR